MPWGSWEISSPGSIRLGAGRILQKYILLDCHLDCGIRKQVGEGWVWKTFQHGERKGCGQGGVSGLCLPGWCQALAVWTLLRTAEDINVSCVTGSMGRQIFHDGGRFKCVTAAPNHFVPFAWQEASATRVLGEHPWGWDLHLPTPMWQMLLTGSPAPVPSLQDL